MLALMLSLLFVPACKGCSGDEKTKVNAADSSSDVAADSVTQSEKRRKVRKRARQEKKPNRRRVEAPVPEKERPKSADTKVKASPEVKKERAEKPEPKRAQKPAKEPTPQIVKVQALQIRDFVQTAELVKLLGQANGMVEAPLRGQEITSDYNHLRLVSIGQKDHLGLIVQVWRDSSVPEARQRHEEYIKSFPAAKPNQSVTRKSFFAQYGDRSYAGFLATGQRTNVVLTCNTDLCSPEQLHKAALAIKTRLVRK
jgi:hypothetical protein